MTRRSLLLGLGLIPLSHFWIVHLELIRYSFPTRSAPFYNAVFILFVLTAANALLKWRRSRAALSPSELLTVYVMVSVASAIQSSDMMGILITLMGHGTYFATAENRWTTLFGQHLPKWLTVQNPKALEGYYLGHSTLYARDTLAAWAVPMLAWSAFALALVLTMLCLTVILRRQWIENERLTYPIAQLPLEMTVDASRFFRNRMMWVGFMISGGIALLNGLAFFYPSLPSIAIKRQNIGQYLFSNPPWDAISSTRLSFYAFAIGLAFIIPLDLSVSCWVFYWFYQMQRVFTRAYGLGEVSDFPYSSSQAFGAYLAVLTMGIWASRAHLKAVLRKALWRPGGADDSQEPMSYRIAAWGAVAGFLFLVVFSCGAGMSPVAAVAFFLIYFALAVLITRIRAELGFPVHDLHGMGPHHTMIRMVGAEHFRPRELTLFSLYHWFNRVYASHPMPHQLEGFKMAERSRASSRGFLWAAAVAAVVAIPACFWSYLHTYYTYGAASAKFNVWALGWGKESFGNLENWLRYPRRVEPGQWVATGFGYGFAFLLGALRSRLMWFPLHPLAYAVANSWGPYNLWSCMLVGSVAKWLVLKMAGLDGYRRATPFFLGLMLGEFVVGSIWTLIGVLGGIPTYDFWF
jgi:hypothetical protein